MLKCPSLETSPLLSPGELRGVSNAAVCSWALIFCELLTLLPRPDGFILIMSKISKGETVKLLTS